MRPLSTRDRATGILLVSAFCLARMTVGPSRASQAPAPIDLSPERRFAMVVAATHDPNSNLSQLYLAKGGMPLRSIASSPTDGFLLPRISPSGTKVAYLRTFDKANPNSPADGELDILDLDGRPLYRILLHTNPQSPLIKREFGETIQVVPVQYFTDVIWLGAKENELAVIGYLNFDINLGDIIYLDRQDPSREGHPQLIKDGGGFDSSGSYSVSPGRLHIATLNDSQRPTSGYEACDDVLQQIEVDGLPISPWTHMAVVCPFIWIDDATFTTIIRTSAGFKTLTVGNIPSNLQPIVDRLSTVAPDSPQETAELGKGFRQSLSISQVNLPIPPAQMSSTGFALRLDHGSPIADAYQVGTTRVLRSFSLSSNGPTEMPHSPNSGSALISQPATLAANAAHTLLDHYRLPAEEKGEVVGSSVWCGSANCGPLRPASDYDAAAEQAGIMPAVCLPSPVPAPSVRP